MFVLFGGHTLELYMPNLTVAKDVIKLSPEQLAGIGLVAAMCGLAERMSRHWVCELSANQTFEENTMRDSLETALVNRTDMKPLLDLLMALYRYRMGESRAPEADQFEKVVSSLYRKFKQRNAILHGFWRPGNGPETIVTTSYSTERRLSGQTYSHTPKSLENLANEILASVNQVADILEKLIPPPPPEPVEQTLRQKSLRKALAQK